MARTAGAPISHESKAHDSDGQLQNASCMDFQMLYASEIPDVVIDSSSDVAIA